MCGHVLSFLLNNELTDFTAVPTDPETQPEAEVAAETPQEPETETVEVEATVDGEAEEVEEIQLSSLRDLAEHLGVEEADLYQNIAIPVTKADGTPDTISLSEWKDAYQASDHYREQARANQEAAEQAAREREAAAEHAAASEAAAAVAAEAAAEEAPKVLDKTASGFLMIEEETGASESEPEPEAEPAAEASERAEEGVPPD